MNADHSRSLHECTLVDDYQVDRSLGREGNELVVDSAKRQCVLDGGTGRRQKRAHRLLNLRNIRPDRADVEAVRRSARRRLVEGVEDLPLKRAQCSRGLLPQLTEAAALAAS